MKCGVRAHLRSNRICSLIPFFIDMKIQPEMLDTLKLFFGFFLLARGVWKLGHYLESSEIAFSGYRIIVVGDAAALVYLLYILFGALILHGVLLRYVGK